MSPRARLFLISCVFPAVALAIPGAAKTDAPQEESKPQGRQARTVTLEFQGPLRDVLKKIAAQAGISLIITGELDQPAEVVLNGASPEDALATVARLHDLRVERQGSIWTVRPMTAEERGAAREGRGEEAEVHPGVPMPVVPSMVPTPPAPPVPPVPPIGDIHERIERKLTRKMRRHDRDVAGTGSVVVDEGETVGDAVAFGGSLTVNGHVEGDAVAFGGDVRLGERAVVEGDVTAFGGEVIREEGAVVEGKVTKFGGAGVGTAIAHTVKHTNPEEKDEGDGSGFPGFLLRFALMFAAGFLCMMFAPNQMRLLAGELRSQPVRCAVVGLVGAVALIPLTLALTITIIGIPVMLALWVMVCVGVVMGFTALANEIGNRLPALRNRRTQAVVLAAGLLILLLVGMIPVLGPLALSIIGLLSLGAIIRTRFGTREVHGIPQPV